MTVDLSSFIRFTAHVDGRSTIGLGGAGGGGASGMLSLQGSSPVGRILTTIRNAIWGPSEAESLAVQAFIQAIRQEYGSEGAAALKRLGVDEHKPIHSFQVQSMARRLDSNRSNPELHLYRELPPASRGAFNNQGTDRSSLETPLFQSIRSAMALHFGTASSLLDDLSWVKRDTPQRKLALAVAVAVMSDNPRRLMAIPEFNAQYQKRLGLADTALGSAGRVEWSQSFNTETEIAGIVARLMGDIFAQA